MLILTRKKHETIRIGDDVEIKIIRTSPSIVKVGIDAPQNVRIVRGELLDRGDNFEIVALDSLSGARRTRLPVLR